MAMSGAYLMGWSVLRDPVQERTLLRVSMSESCQKAFAGVFI